ncbi:polyhydroxyalkanoate depolymerase [Alteriqipengyuania flavescens]|uniref:polyhydroxyalkanoate depolymerase n=1 Tax=Alteriqipengyuania flavescens TaxID=3053610 RepID=UPI0025B612A8|nr:polyhydroxyalkanoate depolymerase [Alteriqipengyuania flavescens]WJY19401.1 polyhydroxyalkanoate depolymerase [Alteriqipengyuania flavescens]WJY25343.1 polyhydroxyalkanoate depolymerase [Alteriqipengyuania flavescens]
MLYNAYEMQRQFLSGASAWAAVSAQWLTNPRNPLGYLGFTPMMASALDVFSHASASYGKPAFGIETVPVDGKDMAVTETVVERRAFGDLRHFKRDGLPEDAPRLLIVAPMSGHYATLLRGTVARMVESAEVWVTDWADARTVNVDKGTFDLDDYIDYLIDFLGVIGPDAHMLAVCQPSVPALAATAVMAKSGDPNRPVTLTMMGGPIDTRQSPTTVNDLAMQRPLAWFRTQVITTVPLQYEGAGRRVYPGFLQLAGFMTMNLGEHMMSHYEMFKHLRAGDDESAEKTKDFYEEYRSVCDMTAEFYLQTVEEVFQKHSLPKGEFMHRGELVDLGAITDTAILAIEGERDDISGIGQTRAALDITPGLSMKHKKYHLAPGAGHYGIFNGSKWREQIAPVVEEWMASHPATGG